MKIANLTNKLSKVSGRTGLMLKKHSPEILLVVGISGAVYATFEACKATLQFEEVLGNHHSKVDKVHEAWELVESGEIPAEEYSEQDRKKDLTVVYAQTAFDFFKLYAKPLIIGTASITCIVCSHGIMRKRTAALTAAYASVAEAFNLYRKRVVEELGEETDYMYKNGLKSEAVTEVEKDEDGKPVKVKKNKLAPVDGSIPSMYARYFDESSREWSKTYEYNMMKLRATQNYYNDLLKTRGNVFLNEIYDALDLPRTQAGAAVGWVFDKEKGGDNFIDFGIFDGDIEKKRDFVNGYERSILLDFNVDGVIWDLI